MCVPIHSFQQEASRVVDSNGNTGLHDAADTARVEDVRAMLRAGAGVNRRNNDGCTPLHLAARHLSPEYFEIVSHLVWYCNMVLKRSDMV
jgi:ankyrin repeat protein